MLKNDTNILRFYVRSVWPIQNNRIFFIKNINIVIRKKNYIIIYL